MRQTKPISRVFGPETRVGVKNKPNPGGREGRDWGLEIGAWGFEPAGAVPLSTKCETKPILAKEASALMME
jgi:hypothetical protein